MKHAGSAAAANMTLCNCAQTVSSTARSGDGQVASAAIFRLKETLKRARSMGTFWIAEQTLDHQKSKRIYELGIVLSLLPPQGRLLEIGAGTGWQAQALASRGYDVCAIDLASSEYAGDRVWPITQYDGHRIPFEDNTFDIVFSSNALEHIRHVYEFQNEIHRVLKPGGCALHVLPSSSWRFWTNITHILRYWKLPRPHGEHAGNALSEIACFSHHWWVTVFRATGWTIVARESNRLFYTGNAIMDSRLSLSLRRRLSRALGGSCNIFLLQKRNHLAVKNQ